MVILISKENPKRPIFVIHVTSQAYVIGVEAKALYIAPVHLFASVKHVAEQEYVRNVVVMVSLETKKK